MARRQHLTLSLLLIVFLFLSVSYFFTSAPAAARDRAAQFVGGAVTPKQQQQQQQQPKEKPLKEKPTQASKTTDSDDAQIVKDTASPSATTPSPSGGFSIDVDSLPSLDGDSIAPTLENATLKAELGQATWRFLHTMAARFPDKPTKDERTTFEQFMHLFGRLYPCGDCARHFRSILAEYPPQSGSRSAAAGWLCFAHNLVNKRLEKPEFDCTKIGDFYDCGCADDDKKKKKGEDDAAAGDEAKKTSKKEKDKADGDKKE
ncbi:FAD dependent sulfhydryl oxidase Erv2 [Cordyceps fumosorosea ARSEF 2679]|uniref:Sulfhydryl oxidase n=1 Tax=Cordyceps fumosorosea (strain ARSEF 2679) TaxID=1081104 RepID=A0A167RLG4_CORFA|nr:FAD dependent sulfhydryl oxidase Erv2 [Cordyceps fumosorosea ARSEF 2679]OAA58712.1 FAD dependent sulfhydryl oxidase Erv2 [Cordyceps fumosorosea ARSEF 2679]